MLAKAHRPLPGLVVRRVIWLAALVSVCAASMSLMSAADASAAAPVAQTLGALVHTATDGPSVASAVGPRDAQTIPLPAVAPTQPPAAGADPPSPPAAAAPLQSAVHAATQVAGAVHTTGERVAALTTDTVQGASHADPATIVRTVVERTPVGAIAGDVQRATQLPQGSVAQTARGVTRVLVRVADPAQTVRTLVGGGAAVNRTVGTLAGGGGIDRTLGTLAGVGAKVDRTPSKSTGTGTGTGTGKRSAGPATHPVPGASAPAAHDGARFAPAPVAVGSGAEAQRQAFAAQAQAQAGMGRSGTQTALTTSTRNTRTSARAPTGAAASPWRDTQPLHDGQSTAPSPAHGAPTGTPLSVAPPSPGGVSPATAVGSGAGLSLGLGLVALLVVLSAPPAARRLRLDDESWRRAPLMLIADRPG